jgi:hypothetical protein
MPRPLSSSFPRWPKDHRGKEEDKGGVATVLGVGNRHLDRPVEEVQAPKPQPRIDEEPAESRRADGRVDHAGEDLYEACPDELLAGVDGEVALAEGGGDLAPDPVVDEGVAPAVEAEDHEVAGQRSEKLDDQAADDDDPDPPVALLTGEVQEQGHCDQGEDVANHDASGGVVGELHPPRHGGDVAQRQRQAGNRNRERAGPLTNAHVLPFRLRSVTLCSASSRS